MPEFNRICLAVGTMFLALTAAPALADPWAKPGDLALRHDIQLLADAGIIRSPVNTWPIPWATLAHDLGASPADTALDPELLAARARLQARIERVRGLSGRGLDSLQPNAKVAWRSNQFWLRTFEDTPREDDEVRAGVSWMGQRFAARAQVSFVADPIEGDREWRGDGSYIAGLFGNQIIYAGALDRWWGPSHDNTLILSSAARPVPGLGIERNVATPFQTKWLSWLGPWSYSYFWGFLEGNREVPNARLMALRFSVRPMNDLEIGLSRTAQWCGSGRPCDAGTVWDVIIGRDNVGDRGVTEEDEAGNQLAAVDFRWQSPFMRGPWAIYGQAVAEDEAGGFPSRYFGQFGFETWGALDTRLFSGGWRAHLEYTNTLVHFWQSEPLYNAAYEHSIYRSGYRYHGRSLGAAADSDSQLISAGLTLTDENGGSWNGLLRFAELNNESDGTRSNDQLHSVTPQELKTLGAHLSHRRPLRHESLDLGMVSLGLGMQRTENQVTGESETDWQAFVQWNWDYSGL